jgi:hypothetical protein
VGRPRAEEEEEGHVRVGTVPRRLPVDEKREKTLHVGRATFSLFLDKLSSFVYYLSTSQSILPLI